MHESNSLISQLRGSNYIEYNKSLSVITRKSCLDIMADTATSDLEKAAIDQYRTSDENMEEKFNILEREAQEQYN